jgi:hypothetical protein
MDNFRRGLFYTADAGTGLAAWLSEFKHQNSSNTIGIFLGPVTRSCVVTILKLPTEALNIITSFIFSY